MVTSGCAFDRLGERTAALRRDHPGNEVGLWCEDEARLGFEHVARRAWALRGTRPTSNGRHTFESLFVYGFAHPGTGRSRFSVRPKANAACRGEAPADFAGWADPGGRKVLVLVVGGSVRCRRASARVAVTSRTRLSRCWRSGRR